MALVDNAWYVNFGNGSSTGYYAVAVWSNHTAVAGELIRQLTAPAVGSERVFVCTTAGATGAVEPTWVNTRGALNTSSVAVYQECTGIAALNGDATNTPTWTITATPPGGVKNTVVTLGQVIKRDNGASYQICTVAGTAGNGAEPAFSNTAGTTTADNTVTWTSLGAVGNFTGWQAPHARVTNASTATWGQSGNVFYIGDNHAETAAANITIIGAGGNARYLCVNKAGSLPPVSADLRTTGTISATLGGVMTLQTGGYYYGLTFTGGSGANSTGIAVISNAQTITLQNCALVKGGSVANGNAIAFGSGNNSHKTVLINTTVTFGNVLDSIVNRSGAMLIWQNTPSAIGGAIFPANGIFYQNSGFGSSGNIICQGVDLSALASGATILGNGAESSVVTLIDCKLPVSPTYPAGNLGAGGVFNVIRGDSGATNYINVYMVKQGSQIPETTIVRTGGASDGTTPISWKIVTTTVPLWIDPFVSEPIGIWNDSTSAITTLTIYGTTTGGGVPNNDDIWVEVEYLGSSTTPQGSFITTTKADVLAPSTTTNNSADGSTWGGAGAGNGFKIVVPSFTPLMKGPLNITVKVAKASSTYYIDPRPSISGVTVGKSEILAPGVYANELSSGGTSAVQYRPNMSGNV